MTVILLQTITPNSTENSALKVSKCTLYFVLFFGILAYNTAQTGLKYIISLPRPLECWGCTHVTTPGLDTLYKCQNSSHFAFDYFPSRGREKKKKKKKLKSNDEPMTSSIYFFFNFMYVCKSIFG